MQKLLGTVPNFEAWGTNFGTLQVVESGLNYEDGSKHIQVLCEDGEPFATLTVCMHRGVLSEGRYLVKTWSENEYLARRLLAEGLFRDTGDRVGNGFVNGEVWELCK